MEIRVLGPIEVVDGEGPISVGGPRLRRIVAALAMNADEVLSVDRLADITWAENELPQHVERNIRTYLHRIRTAVPDDLAERFVTNPPGYALHLQSDELDAARFEESCAAAGRLHSRGDNEGVVARVGEALQLWRGRPYAEFADEEWARAEVGRLDDLRAGAIELRCEALLQLGRGSEALTALDALIAEHPLRERPRALYMQALYRAGRQAEALRAFQDFRSYVIDEAGVSPSDELVELDRSIAAGGLEASVGESRVRGYEIHERIGTGAFAEVYRGTQPALDRDVAIKAIRSELANRPEFIRGFEAEAAMVARLEHPHIVPLYDFWREPDRAYLVMRWLSGGSLEASLDGGPWPVERVATLAEQVGSALTLAHRTGVVHRDVKSANILLDTDGNAYLTDFGIAVEAAGLENPAAALSEGSPAYASPEQLRREPVGPAADIHGLAIALYETITGRLPFAEIEDRADLLRHQLHHQIPPVRDSRPEVPAAIDAVLAIATAKDPAARYQDVSSFVEAFVAALAESPEATPAVHEVRRRITQFAMAVDNPYKGLRAFDEGDAGEFHGRERLIDELLERLAADDHFLAVVGPSGSGKSSVVRAGLVPGLRAGRLPGSEEWFITSMTPGAHPFEALETALLRIAVNPPASLVEQLRGDRRGILRGVRRILPDDGSAAVIVVDQFEELFTLCSDDDDRNRFLEGLCAAATDPTSPVRIVVTLRADFYDEPLRHANIAALLKRHTVTVTPLAADELQQAIVRPAQSVGADFEPGLVAAIVADVASQPGGLPLMQYALTQLFDVRVSGMLLLSTYQELGGLSGALARRADELYEGLDAGAQTAARRVFGRLVTLGEGSDDTRRRVRRSELGGDPATAAVIDAYGGARLLSFDREPATREPTVEVAHEALIREWPRLRQWLDDDRDTLRIQRSITEAAARWDSGGRDHGDLLRGARLLAAEDYAARHDDELNEAERELVGQSRQRALTDQERTRRRQRILRGALVVSTALLVMALVAGLVAVRQWRRADDRAAAAEAAEAAAEADREAALVSAQAAEEAEAAAEVDRRAALAAEADAVATAGELATEVLRTRAPELAASNPVLGTLLAIESHNREPSAASIRAIASSLLADDGWLGNLDIEVMDPVPGGDEVVTLAAGQIAVRSATDLDVIRTFDVGGDATRPIVSPEGDRVAFIDDRTVEIMDLASGDRGRPAQLSGPVPGASSWTWTPNGGHLVVPVSNPTLLTVVRVEGLDATVAAEAPITGPPEGATIWLDHDPERSVLAAGWLNTAVLLSTAELEAGLLTEIERHDLTRSEFPVPVTFVSWGTRGVLYAATLQDGFWKIAEGQAEWQDPDGSFEEAWWVEELSDGTLFVSDPRIAAVRDPVTFETIAGPWPSRGKAVLLPVEVGNGTALAIASAPLGEGRLDFVIRSRVQGTPLSEAVLFPGLDVNDLPQVVPSAGVVFAADQDAPLRMDTREPIELGVAGPVQVTPSRTIDGWIAAIVSAEGFLTTHSLPSGEQLTPPLELDQPIRVARVTFDGSHVVLWDVDNRGATVRDLDTGETVATLTHGSDFTNWLWLPAGPGPGVLQSQAGSVVFDTETFEILRSGLDLGGCSQLDPSGDRFVGKRSDELVIVEWRTGQITWRVPSPEPQPCPAFDVTGRYVIDASGDSNGIQFWDVDEAIAVSPQVPGFAFAQFEPGLAAQYRGGAFHIWNTDPTTWADRACEVVGRNLTQQEWEQFVPGDEDYRVTCPQYPPGT